VSSYFSKAGAVAAAMMFSLLGAQAFANDAGALPGGATTLRETHGDWAVSCVSAPQNGAPAKVCTFAQEQANGQSRQRVLAVELRPNGSSVEGTLVLPFGLALEQGARLQIDEGQQLPPLRFRTCVPAGCLINLNFDDKTLDALRKGNSLRIKAAADGGREVTLAVSLRGFAGALDRTKALAR
jgi:invasion protein IalB